MISPRLAQERVSLAYEQSMAKLQEEAEAAEAELKKKLEQFARNHARGEIENEKDVVDSVPVLDTTISSEKKISFPGNATTTTIRGPE
jgi:F0F1-type ATP synthase membrane subunit b/b'